MSMNTLAEQWETFEAEVVPTNAGLIQRIEMRRAFYAGAASYGVVIQAIALDTVSEAASMAMLEGLNDELARYLRELAAGRA